MVATGPTTEPIDSRAGLLQAKVTGRVGGLGEGTAERAPDMQATSRREGFILRTWVFFSKQPLVALREVGNHREVEAK